MELVELIQTLNAAHGPSGDEGDIRSVLTKLIRPFVDEVRTDTLGNLIAHKAGSGPKLMFSAHMDSIGFIATHIEKGGFIRVGSLGGISPREMLYTPVRFKNGVRGTIVPEEKGDFEKLGLNECYVDIGAKDQVEAREMVQVGDTIVYDTPSFTNGRKVISPYLDNRISCAVLLLVMAQIKESPNDLYIVFSSQEEVGLRGVKTAAWEIAPDFGVVVDVTDVDDTPGSEKCGTAQLGHGAAIKVMDSSVICHPCVVKKMDELAKANNIPVQKDIMRNGGTDAGAIHTTRLGAWTGGISIPCRYIHTPTEMADLEDAENCVALAVAFAQSELDHM